MDGDLVERGGAPVWIEVDGRQVDVSGWRWYPHRWAGGAFTTDYGELQRLLPSPPLHPLRVGRNRALVCAWGAYVPALGYRPPFLGFGEVALLAFVTCGEKPAPPLVPGLSRRAMTRYGFGFFPVMTVVTNRAAAELYRIILGIPAAVADLRVEQRVDRERFVCAGDGRLVWDLTVRSDGRTSAGNPDSEDWFYTVERREIYRVPVGSSGISRSRFGGGSASLVVGGHPVAEVVRRLDLTRSLAAEFVPDRQLWPAGAPQRLGTFSIEIEPPMVSTMTGRLVVSPKPGVEFEVDQGLDGLGWDRDGTFTGPRLSDRAR